MSVRNSFIIIACLSLECVVMSPGFGRADWTTISVMEVKGQAEIKRAGSGEWQPLTGALLQEGDSIRTGPKTRLILKLPGAQANVLRIYSNSELVIEKFDSQGGSFPMRLEVNLAKGNLWAWIDRLDRTSLLQLNVITPNAKAIITGTKMAVSTWEPLETYVTACKGRVEVFGRTGMVTLYRSKSTRVMGSDEPTTPSSNALLDVSFIISNPHDPKLGFCLDCHEVSEWVEGSKS